MTSRIQLDDLTSDQLDALYDRIDHAETELRQRTESDSADAAAGSYAHRAEHAEAAIARVRALHYQQDGAYCAICTEDFGRLQAEWPCPTIAALDEPTPVAGPASISRWWDMRLAELHNAIQPKP